MSSRPSRITGLLLVASVGIGSLALAGCSSAVVKASDGGPTSAATTSTLDAGFYDPDAPPAPEGTIAPSPNSWNRAHPPTGYRVVVVASGDDAQTRVLSRAVTTWATAEHVDVTRIVPASAADLVTALAKAIDDRPDLVITVGDAVVDPLAAISPGALHQRFLVLGAEIAEPTSNVTAADWTGAGFRGEGLGTSGHYDPSTFTAERAGRALRAGVAAVVNDLTGIVVWVD